MLHITFPLDTLTSSSYFDSYSHGVKTRNTPTNITSISGSYTNIPNTKTITGHKVRYALARENIVSNLQLILFNICDLDDLPIESIKLVNACVDNIDEYGWQLDSITDIRQLYVTNWLHDVKPCVVNGKTVIPLPFSLLTNELNLRDIFSHTICIDITYKSTYSNMVQDDIYGLIQINQDIRTVESYNTIVTTERPFEYDIHPNRNIIPLRFDGFVSMIYIFGLDKSCISNISIQLSDTYDNINLDNIMQPTGITGNPLIITLYNDFDKVNILDNKIINFSRFCYSNPLNLVIEMKAANVCNNRIFIGALGINFIHMLHGTCCSVFSW